MIKDDQTLAAGGVARRTSLSPAAGVHSIRSETSLVAYAMGLNSLLRLISITLLAFVLVVLSVTWAWRPAGPLGPALVFSQATVRLTCRTGQSRPLPTVSTPAARTRSAHPSSLWDDLQRNRFWFIGRIFQVEPAVPPHVPIIASPADGDASTNQPSVLRSVRVVFM